MTLHYITLHLHHIFTQSQVAQFAAEMPPLPPPEGGAAGEGGAGSESAYDRLLRAEVRPASTMTRRPSGRMI